VAFAPKVVITTTANINFFILFSPFYFKLQSDLKPKDLCDISQTVKNKKTLK
jgi:hypothetical protein